VNEDQIIFDLERKLQSSFLKLVATRCASSSYFTRTVLRRDMDAQRDKLARVVGRTSPLAN